MNEEMYNSEFFKFIKEHINEDTTRLRLKKYNPNIGFDVQFAITQIECRQKVAKKIPDLISKESFIFPSVLLSEQCTNEIIARFHASLFSGCDEILDLTAGLCIDSYYISQMVKKVTAIEINSSSAQLNGINMRALNANVEVLNYDSADFVAEIGNRKFDAVFADPARRGDNNSKLFGLEDCSPNIISLIKPISQFSKFLIIKASPMLDITEIIRKISNISDIWIIGIKNECKEILIKVDFAEKNNKLKIHTINFNTECDKQEFSYYFDAIDNDKINISKPCVGEYLYEPNCCLMKSNGYEHLAAEFSGLKKFHDNTHLFSASVPYPNFPGRKFVITNIIPFKDKIISNIKKEYPQINVSTRNFKLTANELKKRLKVKDGGNDYLFGVTFQDRSMNLIIAQKAIF